MYFYLKVFAYFDPLGFGSLSVSDRCVVEKQLQNSINNVNIDLNQTESTNITSSIVQNEKGCLSSMQSFLCTIGKKNIHGVQQNSNLSFNEELVSYRSLANREFLDILDGRKVADASRFWEIHGDRLKILQKFAKKYLITPATSVPAESAFSCASYIGRKERSRLSSHNLAVSVFLRDKIDEK